MSETEFLTAEELAEVTGYKHVASQREWLDKNGWPYVVNASGRPVGVAEMISASCGNDFEGCSG